MTSKSPSRGRPRSFDRTAALEAAMTVFWEKGYTATSMSDLCGAMRIASPSLYAAFGSKEQLYIEAIRHYRELGVPCMCRALDSAPTARLAIEAFLKFAAQALTAPGRPSGCMVVLSSVASEGLPALGKIVAAERRSMVKLLEARLRRGVQEGDLPPATDLKVLARFYLTLHQGMSIQARDGATRKELEAIVTTAMAAWPG